MRATRHFLAVLATLSLGCAARTAESPPVWSPPPPSSDQPAITPSEPQLRDNGKCYTDTGYHKGQAARLCLTKLDGHAVECGTAVAFLEMKAAAAREGITLRLVSAFRSMSEQEVLYACYKRGKCPVAAKPGHSHHQDGLALDLNAKDRGVYDWLTAKAGLFGFRRTVASEPWHWERREGAVDVRSLCQS